MAHLAKDADGKLVKNADGHLVNECGNPCDPDPEILATVIGATSGTIHWLGQDWVLPADSGVTKSVCPTFYEKTKVVDTNPPIFTVAIHRWVRGNAGGTGNESLRLTREGFYTNSVYRRTSVSMSCLNTPSVKSIASFFRFTNNIRLGKLIITDTITSTYPISTCTYNTYHTPWSTNYTVTNCTQTGTGVNSYTVQRVGIDRAKQFQFSQINKNVNTKTCGGYPCTTTTTTTARATDTCTQYDIGVGNGWAIPTLSDYLITDDFFGQRTINGITYKWERGAGWPS